MREFNSLQNWRRCSYFHEASSWPGGGSSMASTSLWSFLISCCMYCWTEGREGRERGRKRVRILKGHERTSKFLHLYLTFPYVRRKALPLILADLRNPLLIPPQSYTV